MGHARTVAGTSSQSGSPTSRMGLVLGVCSVTVIGTVGKGVPTAGTTFEGKVRTRVLGRRRAIIILSQDLIHDVVSRIGLSRASTTGSLTREVLVCRVLRVSKASLFRGAVPKGLTRAGFLRGVFSSTREASMVVTVRVVRLVRPDGLTV